VGVGSKLIPKNGQFKMYIAGQAQFKVIVQEEKMIDTILGMFSSRS
jgi:hypothetical protein